MPRLNLYEQQTSASGPRASGADFGAAPAQAMGETANQLFQIGNRIQEREDLSDRQRLRESFEEAAVPMLNDFDKRRDISSKESIPQFRDALTQKRQELISKHVGSPDSRSKLENQLDNLVSQYTKSAIGAKIKADQELMVRTLNQQFDKSALDTNAAPDVWSFSKDENLMLVEEMRPAMSPDQYMAAKRLAYAKPLQSAVKSHLAQGNWESAEAIMRDENFSKFLTAEEAIPLRIDVAVGRGKQDAETKRQDANVARFTMRKGEPLTPEETLRARSLPAKKDMTPADEITELELVQRKPATQDQVDKIFKTYVEGGKSDTMFGNSLQGRALSYVTENAVAYSNGFLTPDKARQFEASFNEAYGTKTYMDPVTGQPKPVTPSVPRFIQDAMSRGSGIYGGMASGATAPGSTPRPGETIQLDINGQTMGQAVVDASGRWSMPAPPESSASPAPAGGAPAVGESPVKGRGLWSMAPKVAGPVAGVARWWGGGPVPLGMGQEEVSAAQYVEQQQKSLVRALQQNPRYAEGERKSIEKDIAITPEAMGNPQAYKLRLVEIGKYIDDELRFNAKVLQNPTGTTVQQRQQAMQSNAALSQFYDQLELPPKVKSLAEAQKLPSNVEEFLDENWILRDGPARRRK
jgi:hypothetical protein